ncbi:MAG: ABC transporter substrate-binding protein [Propionibacteriaceae bacterium]|jgi:polar amino acid transport system substrate-binding protein|nr:ABC transporter substrate-binding protein [Propionibacteriaceae bacterium]
MKRIATVMAGVAGLALVLTGCATPSGTATSAPPAGDPSAAATTEGANITTITPGALTVCSDSPYEPFEFEDDSAEVGYSGYDIDLMGAIAADLGLKLVVIDSDFDALQSGILFASKQCDVGASALTITEERKANLGFSDPYYNSQQSILIAKTSTIKGIEDLVAGTRVGVQAGTTGEIYTAKNAPDATSVAFPSDGEMWLALQAGQVDALLQDLPVNHQHEVADPNYVVVAQYDTEEEFGFAVAKESSALLAAINSSLAKLKASGEYDKIFTKYFG